MKGRGQARIHSLESNDRKTQRLKSVYKDRHGSEEVWHTVAVLKDLTSMNHALCSYVELVFPVWPPIPLSSKWPWQSNKREGWIRISGDNTSHRKEARPDPHSQSHQQGKTMLSTTPRCDWVLLMTLKQACFGEYPEAQFAFKDSMIHWILQFTLLIAACCVLHRCTSQEIHR